ncbi:MAG: hypothetical protein ACTSYI_03000, partial [Promethearchaeota archaeon]
MKSSKTNEANSINEVNEINESNASTRIHTAFNRFYNKLPLHFWGFLGSAITLLGCLIAGM